VGFVVDKVVLGQVYSEYFGFPCQSSFHQLLHNHPHLLVSSGAGKIGQKWPQYKGLDPTPLPIKKNSKFPNSSEFHYHTKFEVISSAEVLTAVVTQVVSLCVVTYSCKRIPALRKNMLSPVVITFLARNSYIN
jgi:hypothetical protein